MKEIKILSSKGYTDGDSKNYGDCILINTGSELIIYDCGSEEHANTVINYMDENNFETAILILSHNDSDHFDGIPTLLAKNKLSKIYTTLLLKYKDDILDRIDDKRRTRDSISKAILDAYNNIAELSGEPIEDIYESASTLCNEVCIIGPDKNYMLDTVAKRLDGREGNTQDGETAVNATSIQVSVKIGKHKLLLCGDSSYAAIEDILVDFDAIQLPHHGKVKQAEKIFEKKSDKIDTLYIISDNTGNSNGGSDNLNTRGHRVKNTKKDGDIRIDSLSFNASSFTTRKTLGI